MRTATGAGRNAVADGSAEAAGLSVRGRDLHKSEGGGDVVRALRKCRHASHRERLASTNCGMQLQLPLPLPLYDPVYSI
eukprot:COSAG02_NODE_12012_length_1613_cov_3.923481_2_plen_79_part_00